jgi:peptide deformylase
VLRIVNYPHPVLRFPSRPVSQIDGDMRSIVEEMFELMYDSRGVGLAANQVALPFRFFVLNLTADPEQKDQEQVFINPEIVKRYSNVEEEEGCLSLPGLYSKVRRAKKIKVRAFNLEGELVEYEAEELFSRAFQHELDHLDGKLFIDRLGVAELQPLSDKLREFELQFRRAQSSGEYPQDAEILQQLRDMTRPVATVSSGEHVES